jgi:hypothetical protein
MHLQPGDIVIHPSNNTNFLPVSDYWIRLVRTSRIRTTAYIATMNTALRAGYYTDQGGLLPFVIGAVPDEEFLYLEVQEPKASGMK